MKQFHKSFLLSFFILFYTYVFSQKNDSLVCTGQYNKDSLKNGVWLCKNGKKIIKKERYKNGILSTYILFNEKGEIIETRNKKGVIKKYNPCGC